MTENKNFQKEAKLKMFLESNNIHYYHNDGSEHVFVYNNSHKVDPSGKRSVVIIPLDEKRILRVENKKIPIDLTEQATKEEIITNSSFMDMLSKKMLIICPEAEAFAIRSTDEAKKEIAQINEKLAPTLDDMFKREKIQVMDEKVVSSEMVQVEVNLTVLECLNRTDMNAEEKLSTIKDIEEALGASDWKYIFENSEGELKEFALSHLNS